MATSILAILSGDQILDSNGDPISGAKLFFYDVDTTSTKTVYSDPAMTVAHSQPVVADSAGRFDFGIYLASRYKIILKTAADLTIETIDDIDAGGFTSNGTQLFLLANGGQLLGDLDANGFEINGLSPGVLTGDAVNKGQLDAAIAPLVSDISDLESDVAGLVGFGENILENPLGYIGIIDQRGQGSGSVSLDGFPVDRWKSTVSSGGVANIAADGAFDFTRKLDQFIENYLNLAGAAVVISAIELDVNVTIHTGSTTTVTLLAGSNVSVTSTWQTGGTAPQTFSIVAASGANDSYEITGLKVEVGSIATAFVTPNKEVELGKCERHFFRIGDTFATSMANGTALFSTDIRSAFIFPRTMASSPTITSTDSTTLRAVGSGFNSISTSLSFTDSNPKSMQIRFTTSGASGGNSYTISTEDNKYVNFATGN